MDTDRFKLIRYIYLYLVTTISIVLLLISTIGGINLGLKRYIFHVKGYQEFDFEYQCSDDTLFYNFNPNGTKVKKVPTMRQSEMDVQKAACMKDAEAKAASREANDQKRDLVWFLSMFIVALPIYFYHWGIIKKENKKA